MELLSVAIDKEASIRLHFSQFDSVSGEPVSREEAHALIVKFAEAFGIEEIKHNTNGRYADDYTIDSGDYRVCCSYISDGPDKEIAKQRRIERLRKELAELENEGEVLA